MMVLVAGVIIIWWVAGFTAYDIAASIKHYETNPSFSISHATVVRGTDTHRQGAAFHNQLIFNICEIPSQIFYSFFSGPNLLSTYLKYILIAFKRI